jgi:hypothetical protein
MGIIASDEFIPVEIHRMKKAIRFPVVGTMTGDAFCSPTRILVALDLKVTIDSTVQQS